MLNTGSNEVDVVSLIEQLSTKFTIKNLGYASMFLGIQIASQGDGYFLQQK